jgi:hypothetical protein
MCATHVRSESHFDFGALRKIARQRLSSPLLRRYGFLFYNRRLRRRELDVENSVASYFAKAYLNNQLTLSNDVPSVRMAKPSQYNDNSQRAD